MGWSVCITDDAKEDFKKLDGSVKKTSIGRYSQSLPSSIAKPKWIRKAFG